MKTKLCNYLQQIAIPGLCATLFFTFFLLSVITHAEEREPIIKLEAKLHRVLMLQWSDSQHHDDKKLLISLFKGLPSQIKGFEKIDVVELIKSSEKFDIAFILVFNSEGAMKAYANHPDHMQIKKLAPSVVSRFSLFDYLK